MRSDFKFDIGDTFTDHNRSLKIVGRELRSKDTSTYKNKNNQKWYKCSCGICGTDEAWIEEYHLKDRGCPVCHGKQVSIGINDTNTTASWITDLLCDKNESKKHTKTSSFETDFVCPTCNSIHRTSFLKVYQNNGISCQCSDGISFPNKFMYSFLSHHNVAFEREKRFSWSDNKIYDIYIKLSNGNTLICENHGRQHYMGGFGISDHNIKINDFYKRSLAIKNEITYYIELDCSISTGEFIYSSIINTELCYLLNIKPQKEVIGLCESYARKSLMKEACYIKERQPNITSVTVGKLLGVDHKTILRYWQYGSKVGWCSISKNNNKGISVYKNTVLLSTFTSARELCTYFREKLCIELNVEMIRRNCRNETSEYKGFVFEYS